MNEVDLVLSNGEWKELVGEPKAGDYVITAIKITEEVQAERIYVDDSGDYKLIMKGDTVSLCGHEFKPTWIGERTFSGGLKNDVIDMKVLGVMNAAKDRISINLRLTYQEKTTHSRSLFFLNE